MAGLGNLASRVLVAVVAVPLILLLIYVEPHGLFWGFIFAASVVGMFEFFSMTIEDPLDRRVSAGLGALAVATLYWLPEAMPGEQQVLAVQNGAIVLAAFPVALYYLFRFGDITTVGRRLAFSVTGIVYVGFLLTFVALLKRDFADVGPHLVVLVLAVAWLSDTGAYTAGRLFGARQLYPAVSPKKTWEGAVGAVLCAAAGGAVLKLWLLPGVAWADILILAAVGSVLGQLGDLVVSFLKRSQGVKDSGGLLAGHGGVLDRFDGVLAIAPFVYVYASLRPV